MTPDDRARLRGLLAAATPGPWHRCQAGGPDGKGCRCGLIWSTPRDCVVATVSLPAEDEAAYLPADEQNRADGDLIAAAVTALPALLDALDAAERERDEARALVDAMCLTGPMDWTEVTDAG